MTTQRRVPTLTFLLFAFVIQPCRARADESAQPRFRRSQETVIAVGYAGLAALRPPVVNQSTTERHSAEPFYGYQLEVSRRWSGRSEAGMTAWLSRDETDGQGRYAHSMLRFVGNLRWYPLGFGRVEPSLGAELGIAISDEFVRWDATQNEGAHSVWLPRAGHTEGLDLGLRVRLSDMLALSAEAAVVTMGFSTVSIRHDVNDSSGNYFLRPADYRTRLWARAALSLELTIFD